MNNNFVHQPVDVDQDIEILKNTPLFQADWYLSKFGDVKILGMDPETHYLKYGALLERNPSPDFDAHYYTTHYPDVLQSGLNPLIHYVLYGKKEGRMISSRDASSDEKHSLNQFPIKDIETKLWGGFSSIALEALEDSLTNAFYNEKDKAKAAFILGRWHAVREDWPKAIEMIRLIRKFNISLYRNKKCKILLIQCLIKNGEFDRAQEFIDFELNKAIDGNFAVAKSNLLQSKMPMASDERLACINSIFEAANLYPIKLNDPQKGFEFDNIYHAFPPQEVVSGPLVSILMPIYKAGEFIDVAIKSLLGQTWSNIEIVAVDDCSPDDSWDKLQAWAVKDSRLKIFRNEKNMGAYPTRNRALELSRGDFITVHDSDDWSHPQMIEVQMDALQTTKGARITCSAMARVHPDMSFILRPQRGNLEYVHRSYPSVLISREDLTVLGEWDAVSANADDEFIQRARMKWGVEAIIDLMPTVPLSFFLVHENSLTQQAGTSLNSLTFGIRKEYARQATYWRKNSSTDLSLHRTSLKSPFPIPAGLAPKNWARNTHYDIILITDMSLLGGTRRCNEGYIQAAVELGLRIGLFHWPRYDLRFQDIADEYLDLCYNENVDILVPEDELSCKQILIHHPPILKYPIDAVPKIVADRISILVNQLPMQLWSQTPFYYCPIEVNELCKKFFGGIPDWIAIAPHVAKVLTAIGEYDTIQEEIWYPPFAGKLPLHMPSPPSGFGADRPIVIGRHSRDHWTKWPETRQDLVNAYCGNAPNISAHFLGGTRTPQRTLGELPSNWDVFEFDSIDVTEFIKSLDFFLHFVHSDYIEEFGRNIMEAMGAGRVVILPASFRDTFGDAAVYCTPGEVESTVRYFWENPGQYHRQAERGFEFVVNNCSQKQVQKRLTAVLNTK